MALKFDQWRFVTIVASYRSYDFMLSTRKDALDLVTAVSEAWQQHKEEEVRKRVASIRSGRHPQVVAKS